MPRKTKKEILRDVWMKACSVDTTLKELELYCKDYNYKEGSRIIEEGLRSAKELLENIRKL